MDDRIEKIDAAVRLADQVLTDAGLSQAEIALGFLGHAVGLLAQSAGRAAAAELLEAMVSQVREGAPVARPN